MHCGVGAQHCVFTAACANSYPDQSTVYAVYIKKTSAHWRVELNF